MTSGRRRNRWRRSLPVLFLVASLPGCAGASLPRPGQAQETASEIEQLKARVLELQRRASVTEVELERLRREVARLGGSPSPQPTTPAPRAPRADAPQAGSPRTPRADAPQAGSPRTPRADAPQADTPSPAPRTPRVDSRAPVVEIEDLQPDDPGMGRSAGSRPPLDPPSAIEESPRGRPAPGAATGAQAEVTPAAQAVYDRGYTLFHQGRYVDAEAGFQRYLQSYPDTELADNALYWIGEARLARGDHRGALAAFQETAERYPTGNKVPDALLKAGESLAALGDGEGARELYRAVIDRFAGTTAAAVARDRLESLP